MVPYSEAFSSKASCSETSSPQHTTSALQECTDLIEKKEEKKEEGREETGRRSLLSYEINPKETP